jgi:hypothetical protein
LLFLKKFVLFFLREFVSLTFTCFFFFLTALNNLEIDFLFYLTHGLLLSIRNEDNFQRFIVKSDTVYNVITASLELERGTFLQVFNATFSIASSADV